MAMIDLLHENKLYIGIKEGKTYAGSKATE